MKILREKYAHILQKLGMGLSLLCAIHCLATPILLVALPTVGNGFLSERLENGLIIGSLLIGSYILIRDYKSHHQSLPLVLFFIAALSAILVFFTSQHVFQLISSVSLAIAFLVNWRMHSKVCSSLH